MTGDKPLSSRSVFMTAGSSEEITRTDMYVSLQYAAMRKGSVVVQSSTVASDVQHIQIVYSLPNLYLSCKDKPQHLHAFHKNQHGRMPVHAHQVNTDPTICKGSEQPGRMGCCP